MLIIGQKGQKNDDRNAKRPKAGSDSPVPVTIPYTLVAISSPARLSRCDSTFHHFHFRTSVESLKCGVTVFPFGSIVRHFTFILSLAAQLETNHLNSHPLSFTATVRCLVRAGRCCPLSSVIDFSYPAKHPSTSLRLQRICFLPTYSYVRRLSKPVALCRLKLQMPLRRADPWLTAFLSLTMLRNPSVRNHALASADQPYLVAGAQILSLALLFVLQLTKNAFLVNRHKTGWSWRGVERFRAPGARLQRRGQAQ